MCGSSVPRRKKFVPYHDYLGSVLEIPFNVQSGQLEEIYHKSDTQPFEAPNWTRKRRPGADLQPQRSHGGQRATVPV